MWDVKREATDKTNKQTMMVTRGEGGEGRTRMLKKVEHVGMEGDWTSGMSMRWTIQMMCYKVCTPQIYIMLLTDVIPINLIVKMAFKGLISHTQIYNSF